MSEILIKYVLCDDYLYIYNTYPNCIYILWSIYNTCMRNTFSHIPTPNYIAKKNSSSKKKQNKKMLTRKFHLKLFYDMIEWLLEWEYKLQIEVMYGYIFGW